VPGVPVSRLSPSVGAQRGGEGEQRSCRYPSAGVQADRLVSSFAQLMYISKKRYAIERLPDQALG